MTKLFSLIIIIAVLPVSTQKADFSPLQLSPKGRVAYERLISTCVFRVGGVGYAGETSKEELALYDLLEDAHAVEALKSLVTAGTYEGGLYGLLGLSLKNNGEFNQAVDVYRARKDARAPQTSKWLECNLIDTDTGEYVGTQSGCILMRELRTKVVANLQSGRYDSDLLPQYRPRRP